MDAEQAYKIWGLSYDLKGKYKKEKLASYLKAKNIDFNLVILNPEEGEE